MKNMLNETSQNIVIEWTTAWFLLCTPFISDATIKLKIYKNNYHIVNEKDEK